MHKNSIFSVIFVFFAAGLFFFDLKIPGRRFQLSAYSGQEQQISRLLTIKNTSEQNKLRMDFSFQSPVDYRINYNATEHQMELLFFHVSRKNFKKQIHLEEDYFEKIQLSYSNRAVYQLLFELKPSVMPLPFSSSGNTDSLIIGFTRASIDKETPEPLQIWGAPPISHLSKQYAPEVEDEIPLQFSHFESNKIESGIEQMLFKVTNPASIGYGFKVHRTQIKRRFKLALAQDKLLGTETLSQISNHNNAVLSLNGSFFIPNGDPIGLLIQDYKLLSTPLYARSSFGILNDGSAMIGHPEFQGELVTKLGKIDLDGINQLTNADKSILYTPEFDARIPAKEDHLHLVIKNNKIQKISHFNEYIPDNGYVLSASPKRYPWLLELKLYDSVILSYGLTHPWQNMKYAIGGGPRLLENGILADPQKESFRNTFLSKRAPRSAVGITEEGNLILVAIDGRQQHSIGLTLQELAWTMKKLGAYNAMNLDGGGSTAIYFRGKILNRPSDGKERKISNALILLQK